MTAAVHKIDDCPQNPVLASINLTLARWDKRMDRQDDLMERQAVAMETIAAHGAIVSSHEKRLDKHDIDFRQMFSIINDDRQISKLISDMEALSAKVIVLEMAHAKEAGEAVVEEKVQARIDEDENNNKKFWTEFKIRMITPVMMGVVIMLWLLEKWDLVQRVGAVIVEFKELFGR